MDIKLCKSWEEVVEMAANYGGDVYFAPAEEFAWGTASVEMRSVKSITIGDLKYWFEDENHVSEMICIWPESKANNDGGHPPYKGINYMTAAGPVQLANGLMDAEVMK